MNDVLVPVMEKTAADWEAEVPKLRLTAAAASTYGVMGGGQAVMLDPLSGALAGASDSRRDGLRHRLLGNSQLSTSDSRLDT